MTLHIGPSPSTYVYTLPRTLLSIHSNYFRAEIARISAATPSTTTDQLALPDVSPHIFGLFLKFIYQGAYPAHVDTASISASVPDAAAPILLPASVLAWILGSRLEAHSFQNHALVHIYTSLGKHIHITPALMRYVWDATRHQPGCALRRLFLDMLVVCWSLNPNQNPNPYANANSYPASGPASAQKSPFTITPGAYVPAPPSTNTKLKKEKHQPSPPSPALLAPDTSSSPVPHMHMHMAARIVAKGTPQLNDAWNALFDQNRDLTREFIFLLQGGHQLASVQCYFTSSAAGGLAGAGRVGGGGNGAGGGGGQGDTGVDVDVDMDVKFDPKDLAAGVIDTAGKMGAGTGTGTVVKKDPGAGEVINLT
ncbi:hypothetical protein BDV95DRAFT_667972 [Massariosphaeria phaeospora]|uniref:BTB domain-containing protein n=1 Tax=Massariosphaeria phaeospora TaxID=100035 RepID=A0A7C8MLJ8_9PLEO|nr:hypothetical protein BDV95DRAFT_667972 [Massariosphaeria phaeospora]